MSFLVPFIGDGFDSLKDAMLGALALRSQLVPLQFLGCVSLSYLVAFHGFLVWNSSNRVELEKAYLPVLFLKKQKPRSATAEGATAEGAGWYQKVLVLMYVQAKPSRQWAMLLEDLPQGMLALVVSSVEGFQAFTVVVNIGVPILRISMAWLLHERIAWQLADWLLEEALKASDAGQFALCEDFIAALHRLQRTSFAKKSDLTLWEHLREKNKACCLEAFQKLYDDQSCMSLRLFVVLQFAGRGRQFFAGRETALFEQCMRQLAASPSELGLPRGFGLSGVMAFLDLIREPQQLTSLEVNLLGEKMGSSGAKALGESLGKLQHITTLKLDLDSNNLGPEGGRALGEQLGRLQQITSLNLDLWNNNLGPEGGRALGESLGKMQRITSLALYLGSNNIDSEGGRALADHLSDLAHLTEVTLDLRENGIDFDVRAEIRQRLQRTGRRVEVAA